MSLSRIVGIGRLYPSGVGNLWKPFRNTRIIVDPYCAFADDQWCHLVKELAMEAEGLNSGNLQKGPCFIGLENRVDAFNLMSEGDEKILGNMRKLQLAIYCDAVVCGRTFKYGVMSHKGEDCPEIAVLFPQYEDKGSSAIIVSDNGRERQLIEGIKLMTNALSLVRGER